MTPTRVLSLSAKPEMLNQVYLSVLYKATSPPDVYLQVQYLRHTRPEIRYKMVPT